jgi:hypothetical protein
MHTYSVNETESEHAAQEGDAFNLNTGYVNFTGNGTLLYFKNSDVKDFVVDSFAIGMGDGGTYNDKPYLTIVRNPTGGDLITNATAGDMVANRNFQSAKDLDALFYKGQNAGTLTGGQDLGILQLSPGGRSFFTINLVLPRGTSVGIKLTNNLSAGAVNVYGALIGHLLDPESKDLNGGR